MFQNMCTYRMEMFDTDTCHFKSYLAKTSTELQRFGSGQ